MRLEAVERECLKVLQGSTNPLVPFSVLQAKLEDGEQSQGLSSEQFLAFLRGHQLMKVVEAREGEAGGGHEELGLEVGPWVILRERLPSEAELSDYMAGQLESMAGALKKALEESLQGGDPARAAQIRETINRLEDLKGKVLGLFSSLPSNPSSPEEKF